MTSSRVNYLRPSGGVPERELIERCVEEQGLLFTLWFFQTQFNAQLRRVPDDRLGEVQALLALCVNREVSELLETLPATRLWRRKSGEHANHEHTAEELVDILLFLMNIAITAGVGPPQLAEAFLAKMEVLRERFGSDPS
jgi:NTP pyrophosphatase (non-canonical NTP hydrolase)